MSDPHRSRCRASCLDRRPSGLHCGLLRPLGRVFPETLSPAAIPSPSPGSVWCLALVTLRTRGCSGSAVPPSLSRREQGFLLSQCKAEAEEPAWHTGGQSWALACHPRPGGPRVPVAPLPVRSQGPPCRGSRRPFHRWDSAAQSWSHTAHGANAAGPLPLPHCVGSAGRA